MTAWAVSQAERARERSLATAVPLACPQCKLPLHRLCGSRWLICVNAQCPQQPVFEFDGWEKRR